MELEGEKGACCRLAIFGARLVDIQQIVAFLPGIAVAIFALAISFSIIFFALNWGSMEIRSRGVS